MIVLRPNGGEDDGSDDVSTPRLLNRADYEYLFTEPAQFHSFTPGTRATYELEARSDGRKIAFNIRHECTDKWGAVGETGIGRAFARAEWNAIKG